MRAGLPAGRRLEGKPVLAGLASALVASGSQAAPLDAAPGMVAQVAALPAVLSGDWLQVELFIGLVLTLILLGVIYWRSRQRLVKLREQQQALNHILWGTNAGTWEWNVQTGETRLNERWAEMLGFQLCELEPTTIDTWKRFCRPDYQALAETQLSAHFRGETDSYSLELCLIHRDGSDVWVHCRGRVVSRDDDNRPLWMAGTHIDITSRKQAEAAAQMTAERLSKLTALLPGTIYQYWMGTDGSMRFPYSSVGIREIYGVTPEEAAQDVQRVFDTIHPDDLEKVSASIGVSAETLSVWELTYRVIHPEKGVLWVQGISMPERLDDGSTTWHGYLRDITASFLIQQERDEYRESLEKSNRELEHFAYAASHDLRQPLRMVTSYAQLLKRHLGDKLDDDGATMLHYMSDGAKRMDDMLLSLLEYSRVGRSGQPFTHFPLRETLDEALHFLAPAIAEAQAEVQVAGEWPEITASRDEMTRLFQNLVGNGLKYQQPDEPVAIHIDIRRRADENDWHITITDNGIGIEPDQIPRLFRVFQRLHTREEYAGTGVGLAVCRKIVERHDGDIWVTSPGKGQGTTFHVTLPADSSHSVPADALKEAAHER